MSQLLSAVELVAVSQKDSSSAVPLSSTHHASGQTPRDSTVATPALSISDTPAPSTSGPSPTQDDQGTMETGRIIITILSLTSVILLQSLCNGFITIALPRMATDIDLPQHLIVWPSAAY